MRREFAHLSTGGSAQSSTTPVTVRVLLDINFHHEGKGNSPLCHSTELTRRVDCGYSKGAKIEMSLLGRLSWGAFSLPVLVPPVQGLQGCLNLLSLVFSSDREGLGSSSSAWVSNHVSKPSELLDGIVSVTPRCVDFRSARGLPSRPVS